MTDAPDHIHEREREIEQIVSRALADWLAVAERLRLLKWHMMADPAQPTAAKGIAHFICSRLHNDLRAAITLVQRGYVLQSLTIAASMLELPFTIGFIGNNAERATAWMAHDSDKSFISVYDAIQATFRLSDQPQTEVDREYAHYTLLCNVKHGNPKIFRWLGVEYGEKDQLSSYHGPSMTDEDLHAARRALFYASRYMALGLVCYNMFHGQPPHDKARDVDLGECLATIISLRTSDALAYESAHSG